MADDDCKSLERKVVVSYAASKQPGMAARTIDALRYFRRDTDSLTGEDFRPRLRGAYFAVETQLRTILRKSCGGQLPENYDYLRDAAYKAFRTEQGRALLNQVERQRAAVPYVAEQVAAALVPAIQPSAEYQAPQRLRQSLDYIVGMLRQR